MDDRASAATPSAHPFPSVTGTRVFTSVRYDEPGVSGVRPGAERGRSSAGRAAALQAAGRRFESDRLHQEGQ